MTRRISIAAVLAIACLIATSAGAANLKPDPLEYVSPSRGFRTVHTALDLDVDLRNRTIAGSVTHTFASLRDGLDEISLNCVELDIASVTVGDASAEFDYPVEGDYSTSWLGRADASRASDMLVIHLPAPVDRGDEVTVTIRYSGSPQMGLYWIQPERGLKNKRYEVWSQGEGEDNRYWIPCYDYPNDKSTYEGRFRVAKGNYALSNGNLIERHDVDGGKEEFYWKLDEPQVSYLIMLAAGQYDVFEEKWNDIPLMYVVPKGTDKATVKRGYGETADMMDFFTKETGIDYPFGKYAQVSVQNFIYGGMENTTATVMNMRTLFDERAGLTRSEQGLVAHELAHMWWGDMVTCREWSHMWLNEGFATYYQTLFRRHQDGEDAFLYEILGRHRQVVAADKRKPRPIVTDFYSREDRRNNANIYTKGSSVLHMLRYLVGDELYTETIRHYANKFKYDVVETSDLARAFKDVTGENLDWFFEEWVYLAGHPEFEVTKKWDADDKVLHLNVKQKQTVDGLVPLFRMPVDIEITTAAGTEVKRVWVENADHDFYFSLDSKPKMVIFDKGNWILKELTFKKPTGELLYQLAHGDYIARVRAAIDLGGRGSEEGTVAALRDAMLADGHYGLRREAAQALGKVGNVETRDALLDGLASGEARVRLACAEALGNFDGDEKVAARLLKALDSDRAYEVQAAAVTSIVKIKSEKAADACYAALKLESDRGLIRNAGLNGLVELEDTGAMSKIRGYCTSGNSRDHRHTAIEAYARLAKKLDNEHDRESAASFLEKMLDDWYLRTRRTVITALGTLGEPSSVAALRKVQSNDPLASLRGQARRTADAIEAGERGKEDDKDLKAKVISLENKFDEMESAIKDLRKAAGSD